MWVKLDCGNEQVAYVYAQASIIKDCGVRGDTISNEETHERIKHASSHIRNWEINPTAFAAWRVKAWECARKNCEIQKIVYCAEMVHK